VDEERKHAMTLAAILQPHYLPWIGYFEMIDRVDVFVFLDDADFIKREWKNRNRIRSGPYETNTRWLTVSVPRQAQHDTPLCEVPVAYPADSDWPTHHARVISGAYCKAPAFPSVAPVLDIIAQRHDTLANFNMTLVRAIMRDLGISTPLVLASDLKCDGFKTAKLVSICKAVGATHYLANNTSSTYLDLDLFTHAGIAVSYQDYVHPEYVQRFDGRRLDFISHLSVVDLICNIGTGQAALDIVRQGRARAKEAI
jgi:hypothetical protein